MTDQDRPLPGLAHVRDVEHTHPPVADVPRADPHAFELRAPRATEPTQPSARALFDSIEETTLCD